MRLVYRTRGDTSPQGKPRVYFTGHPADLAVYAEDIFADILLAQNCAIYYDVEAEASYDESVLKQELEQMQLFVIPVTMRFLCQPNRARDVEFPFALAHHIPVLPLQQEPELANTFNAVCGDLQMLDKHDPDRTALPYAQKLEKFLAAILVGDELAEKIRGAFDAYVFLSYRKKDRQYAQELMRLIHQNEFCRDIAIWYDEFLTPGENFNDAIAEALAKCHLFALAVTPNIMENGNYVMTTEYPEAKKIGKPILPVEMAPTNHFALWRKFRGLPRCAKAQDSRSISEALLEALRSVAIEAHDGSPEHDFFIGLAYLNGIDMEVDRSRALSLITNAAEQGVAEAMEKLVHMYHHGDGVMRDQAIAISWLEKLADHWQARFEQSSEAHDAVLWLYTLIDLVELYLEVDEFALAQITSQEVYDLAEFFIGGFILGTHDVWFKRQLVNSALLSGRIAEKQGQLADALAHYERALERVRLLWQETHDATDRRSLSAAYSHLGRICEAEGRSRQAEAYHLQEIAIDEALYHASPDANAQKDLSISYAALGNVRLSTGDLIQAKALYTKANTLARQFLAERRTVDAKEQLLSTCNHLGDICRALGEFEQAMRYFQEMQTLAQQIFDETATPGAQHMLSLSYERLAIVAKDQGQLESAQTYYERSLALDQERYQTIPTVEARRSLAMSLIHLGDIAYDLAHYDEAKDYYGQSLTLHQALAEETQTVNDRRALAISYEKSGSLCLSQGHLEEAKDYYLQVLALRRTLYETSETAQAREDLAISYHLLGDVARKEGQLTKARSYYEKCLRLRQALYAAHQIPQIQRGLAIIYEDLGEVSQAEGDLDEAKAFYEQSMTLLEALCAQTQTVDARQILAICYNKLGCIYFDQQDLALAKDYFTKSYTIRQALYDKTGTQYAQKELAKSIELLHTVQ